jgi:disulfide bond formation protein DsbB
MTKQINSKLLFFILIIVSLVLVSAYIIEYELGHKPCKLCLYERIPYFVSIILILKIFYTKSYNRITLLVLSLIFIISSILAFYHFGIEQGFFNESFSCTAENVSSTLSKEQLLEKLEQSSISCKNVSFRLLGLSLAAVNNILSIFLSVIFMKLFLNYGKN